MAETSPHTEFALPKSAFVTLRVYDLLGMQAEELVNERLESGNYNTQWDARELLSGVYFYRLSAGELLRRRKCYSYVDLVVGTSEGSRRRKPVRGSRGRLFAFPRVKSYIWMSGEASHEKVSGT